MQGVILTLQPAAVAEPAQQAAVLAAHVVAECVNSLAGRELHEPQLQGEQPVGIRFTGSNMSSDERRAMYQSWLFSKGFQDLARGVRASLEEAYLFVEVVKWRPAQIEMTELERRVAEIKEAATKLHFPPLLSHVNASLREPLNFDAEFLSLQKVRNCLEHRGGIVGPRDLDEGADALSLTFPRMRCFFKEGDREIEIIPGTDSGVRLAGDQIFIDRVSRSKTYRRGERVTFTAADFNEIAFACHMVAGELASKLPVLRAPGEE